MSMVSQTRVEVASKFVYILLETEMGVYLGSEGPQVVLLSTQARQ